MKAFAPMLSAGSSEDRAANAALQKSAYLAVRGIVQHPAASGDGTVEIAKILQLWAVIRDARQTCEASALKTRFACVQALLGLVEHGLSARLAEPLVSKGYLELLAAAIPEIMFHLREASSAVRGPLGSASASWLARPSATTSRRSSSPCCPRAWQGCRRTCAPPP